MEDLSAFGQLVQSILPNASAVGIFDRNGQLRWSSKEADMESFQTLIASLMVLTEADQEQGTERLDGEVAQYAFRVRDAAGSALGMLAFAVDGPFPQGKIKPARRLKPRIAPVLSLLGRDLKRDRALETIQQFVDETTQLEALRRPAPESGEGDSIERLLTDLATELDADVVLAAVPGYHFERCYVRPGCRLQELELLRREGCDKILQLARTQNEVLCVNKSRLRPDGEPFRFVSVPLRHQGIAAGMLAVCASLSRPRLHERDSRLLDRIAPRLLELVELRIDSATGLPTRAALEHYLASRPVAKDAAQCIVYLDLDQMHVFNDLFGLDNGDAVLRRLAAQWPAGRIGPSGLMGHLSGDRFAAVLDHCTLNQARTWAENTRGMIEQLELPPVCGGFKLTASFGVAVIEAGAKRFEAALACAATACRAAKDRGRNRVALFTDNDRSLLQRQEDLHLFRRIVAVLEARRFELLAQPIVPLSDPTRATQYELLVRLVEGSGVVLSPSEFLSAATRYQLLPQLDRGVLQRALADIAPYANMLAARRTICWINVSGPSIGQPDFADFVRTSIKGSAVPGALIGFEITEGAAIGNHDAAIRFIERVCELGCSFALDDFGTGFSSLSYLKTLAVSSVKIDGAFIRDLLTDARSEALVSAVLDIARQLRLDTVAEYIENQETEERLRALGVTYGQGYHFARPRPLRDLLSEFEAAAAPDTDRDTDPASRCA